MENIAQPQTAARIETLDLLRGFALLGILVMNIQVMAMISAAYSNPTAYGDLTGSNYFVWWIGHVFFDQKMMSLFSILFGAGIALMTNSVKKRTGKSASLHYRRMFWLLLIGLVHAYLIWGGDILVSYAICGCLVYLVRNWKPRFLFVIGLVLFSMASLLNFGFEILLTNAPEEALADMKASWDPPLEAIQEELDNYRGGWIRQMDHRVKMAFFFETLLFGVWAFWRASGLMLIGNALFRWKVLTGERSSRFYAVMAIVGLVIGLPIVITGLNQNFANNWDMIYCQFKGSYYNYWGSLFVAFGYIGIVCLLSQSSLFPGIGKKAMCAVGQMALTNYLLQSVIGTFIFYGHGFGYFGYVSRTGQLLIVMGIWAFQIVFSYLWLQRFRFGPMEWLWRTLTYWRIQPITKLTD